MEAPALKRWAILRGKDDGIAWESSLARRTAKPSNKRRGHGVGQQFSLASQDEISIRFLQ
jgi:hypothetical protein